MTINIIMAVQHSPIDKSRIHPASQANEVTPTKEKDDEGDQYPLGSVVGVVGENAGLGGDDVLEGPIQQELSIILEPEDGS